MQDLEREPADITSASDSFSTLALYKFTYLLTYLLDEIGNYRRLDVLQVYCQPTVTLNSIRSVHYVNLALTAKPCNSDIVSRVKSSNTSIQVGKGDKH